MDFTKDYILENEVTLLTPLKKEDWEKLLPYSLNESEIWNYSITTAAGENNLREYINLALEGRENKTQYPFIIFDKRVNQFAGSTRFYDIQIYNKALQLGYTWYGKDFQRTGLNRNCKYLLLEFAFDTLGMERVEFRADVNNKRSIAAMKNIGCIEEGILRSNVTLEGGRRRDSIVLSILRHEWYSEVKTQLKNKIF